MREAPWAYVVESGISPSFIVHLLVLAFLHFFFRLFLFILLHLLSLLFHFCLNFFKCRISYVKKCQKNKENSLGASDPPPPKRPPYQRSGSRRAEQMARMSRERTLVRGHLASEGRPSESTVLGQILDQVHRGPQGGGGGGPSPGTRLGGIAPAGFVALRLWLPRRLRVA